MISSAAVAAAAGGAAWMRGAALAKPQSGHSTAPSDLRDLPPGEPGRDYTPVVTPNGMTLPYKLVDGVKVFHLVAGEFDHEIAPGLVIRAWGYNGRTPGPTIEACLGDRVRIYVTNTLPEPTTVHWHGVIVPSGMDGVAGLSQPAIPPGETFKYEFTLVNTGTHMYHSHFDEMVQIAMGMTGIFVIHPREPRERDARVDRDFAIMLGEWRIDPGTKRPTPLEMIEFNIFTMNSRAFPGTEPLVAKLGDRVRIRLCNLGPMDHHPIHLHGYDFHITETDGGRIPESAQWPGNTILVPVGQTRAVEFIANNPGDFAMHCHMTHHTMNQMGHAGPIMVGLEPGDTDPRVRDLLPGYMTMGHTGMGEMGAMQMPVPPNSIPMKGSAGPFGYIDMGGMFTILKVREGITTYDDPGWYAHPPGTVASRASEDELRRDGIATTTSTSTTAPTGAVYTCSMHPEVISDIPGNCPKCGMRLVPKK
jgi:FtsP/CotA-like multicopper oxidase with cupredoxin domain